MEVGGRVLKVSGPLIVAEGLEDAAVSDVVHVGEQRIIGEILSMAGGNASIQVYEDTFGIGHGATVETDNSPLFVELGPGLLENIYDGVQRPLAGIREMTGSTIAGGVDIPALSRTSAWDFAASLNIGDSVIPGDVIGAVPENGAISHKIMVPYGVSGVITAIGSGSFTVSDVVATVLADDGIEHRLTLMHKWPVRLRRPFARKHLPEHPLSSGQRVIDTMFPLAKGGSAAVLGPFGSGKTILLQSIAKWSDVDVVVYIGCGERGSEVADMLTEFPELTDPRTGESLMKRTVLIANTSDMPIAAREACIYTGITIAEYFRDMGYDVAVIADSTTRWAEALREIGGRLGELPFEEGYPAYLASRLTQFYECAGVVECLGADTRRGSLTVVGAVSPPGGDMSEPVSQATMRIAKTLWGLDGDLARERHFPAVNWLTSYSPYAETLKPWYDKNLTPAFMQNRDRALRILQKGSELLTVSGLLGQDALSAAEQLTLETAAMIRENFLRQDAFDPMDSLSSYERQFLRLGLMLKYDGLCRAALDKGANINDLLSISARGDIDRAKNIPNGRYAEECKRIEEDLAAQINGTSEGVERL